MSASAFTLHVPDEPVGLADTWLGQVADGAGFVDVLAGEGGLTDWLWRRWNFLTSAGMTRDLFSEIVLGYQRELWLWLAGERTWTQACSGLTGRLTRRLARLTAPVG